MNNKEIAKVLYDIADILEIQGEISFKIVAYRNAARTIEFLAEDINDIYKAKGLAGLDSLEGVGKGIAERIEELIKTGKLKYLEQLKHRVAAPTILFMHIPGVGPKTAQKLYTKLNAQTIEGLEAQLKAGKGDKWFKEKTRDNILRGIEILKRMTGRTLLPIAEPVARHMTKVLEETPGVKQVHAVGSLRRMKETVGDIDFVCASTDPAKAIEAFTSHPDVDKIIAKGKAKATVIHKESIQLDLEILPEKEYGSLLQHFTGSKEHNVALRTWAQAHGMSISEHGIKRGGKLYTFSKEEDVYKFLGMDWIPPELREDRGEIEAALKHKLPDLIEVSDIRGDLQGHSVWSDGHDHIETIVQKAIKLGYEYIAFTDHSKGLGVAHGMDERRVKKQWEEIDRVQKKSPKTRILKGMEVDIRANGDLDMPSDILEQLDVVVASVHSAFNQTRDQLTSRIVGAIKHPSVDIIGHPSGRILGTREPYDVDWDEVFRAAARYEVALEINAFPNRLDLSDNLVFQARQLGITFAIDTDFHEVSHLDLMRYGVAVARRGWLTKNNIINTLPLAKLHPWLSRTKRVQ
jgi:DNA polymerase (family 10)